MIKVKIIFDGKNPLLSNKNRRSEFQAEIETFLKGEDLLGEPVKVRTIFIQGEIQSETKNVEIEMALDTKKSLPVDYCKSLGGRIRVAIKKSRLALFTEFKEISMGFEIRGSNYMFRC